MSRSASAHRSACPVLVIEASEGPEELVPSTHTSPCFTRTPEEDGGLLPVPEGEDSRVEAPTSGRILPPAPGIGGPRRTGRRLRSGSSRRRSGSAVLTVRARSRRARPVTFRRVPTVAASSLFSTRTSSCNSQLIDSPVAVRTGHVSGSSAASRWRISPSIESRPHPGGAIGSPSSSSLAYPVVSTTASLRPTDRPSGSSWQTPAQSPRASDTVRGRRRPARPETRPRTLTRCARTDQM